MPAGHFVLCAGLSSNSGVLGNGCLIHCINTFPYYRSICTLLNILHYKLALLVYKCLQGVAPSYLADDLCRTADVEARHRLLSASSPSLLVRRCGCRRTATKLSQLLPRESGTVCHITSRLHSHCLFSAVVWRLISSATVFVGYIVVPAKWHLSLWTH